MECLRANLAMKSIHTQSHELGARLLKHAFRAPATTSHMLVMKNRRSPLLVNP